MVSSRTSDLGKRKVYKSGQASTVLVLPKQWIADNQVRIGDVLHCVIGMKPQIRLYKTNEGREEWTDPVTVREYLQGGKKLAAITITGWMTDRSGLGVGDVAVFSGGSADGALTITRGET